MLMEENDYTRVYQEELKTKSVRIDELNILLNMDHKDNEIVDGEPDSPEKKKDKDFER